MAQQLWLLRHGDAEPHGTRDDHDRKLSERGIEQARAAGKALAALGFEPTAVLTSPKVRARDTAAEACGELVFKAVEFAPLAGGFDGAAALELCGPEHGDRVLIVGHEPDFSQIVYDLTGARIDMKKGGLAGIRIGSLRRELIVLMRPHELIEIARKGDQ
jgi:phosphohistidine phosphatase